MIRPILWKEYREQRWKLAFGTVMLLFFTGSFAAARVTSDREIMIVIWICGGLLFALYSAMGVFAPEHSNRTAAFLASRPIAPWKTFACKWFVGWLNFAVPLLACTLCFTAFLLGSAGRVSYTMGMIAKGAIGGVCLATMFYTLIISCAPRKSSEAAVGLVALMVVLAMVVHLAVFEAIGHASIYDQSHPSTAFQTLCFVNPVHWLPISMHQHHDASTLLFLAGQSVVFALAIWTSLRKWQRSV